MWLRNYFFKPKPIAIIKWRIKFVGEKIEHYITYILKENIFNDRTCKIINTCTNNSNPKDNEVYTYYISPWLNYAKEIKDFNLDDKHMELCKK